MSDERFERVWLVFVIKGSVVQIGLEEEQMKVSAKLINPFLNVGVFRRRVLRIFCSGSEVFDRIADVEVCCCSINGVIDNLLVSVPSIWGCKSEDLPF